MGSLTKVGFAGSNKCDLVLYFSRIANAAGKKTAIIDASLEQHMEYCVPNNIDNKTVTYRNVDVHLDCKDKLQYEQIDMNKYEAVFIDYGFNNELAECMLVNDLNIIVSDLERYNVLKLKVFLKALADCYYLEIKNFNSDRGEADKCEKQPKKMSVVKIYRDLVKSKIDTKYIDSLTQINELFDVTAEYIYYLDGIDCKCRIESQYNDFFKFGKLSKSYNAMFLDVFRGVLGLDAKSSVKAVKKAERGL